MNDPDIPQKLDALDSFSPEPTATVRSTVAVGSGLNENLNPGSGRTRSEHASPYVAAAVKAYFRQCSRYAFS
jgi:hypothetical protein